MAVNPNPSNLSQQQIIQRVMDESEDRLRVDAIVTATIADVIIDAAESSIAIGDQHTGNLMTVNPDGSINADTIIESTEDNIAIGNQAGTNFLAVNADGSINVDVASSTLPAGAATAANQVTGNTSLSSIDSKLTSPIAVSQSGTWNLNNISGTVSLPTGASTSSLQTTGNTSLASIDSKLTSPITVTGPLTDTQLRASPVPISGTVTANAGTNLNTSALALESGGHLASIDAKVPSLGQALAAASVPVVLTAAQLTTLTPLTTVAVTQSTSPWVDDISQFGGSNVVTGTGTSGAGIPRVTVSSDSSISTSLKGPSQANTPFHNAYVSTNITTGAYVQLVASTTTATNSIEIYDTSGQILYLATGGVGSEVNLLIIPQGGNGLIPVAIPAGTRISAKAITATANSGYLDIDFWS